MSWFKDANLSLSKITSAVPTSAVNIAGDVIRGALGRGREYRKVRNIKEGDYQEITSLSNLLTDIRTRGIARNNRFIVKFYAVPSGLLDMMSGQGVDFETSLKWVMRDNLAFASRACESASFPGLNFQTQEIKHHSYLEKIPTLRNYNETTWTFRCDNEMLEKKFFDMWSALIIDKQSGDLSFKTDYQTMASVIQFDEHGKATYAILLEGLFPTSIADLDLNHSTQGDYHRLSVTFAFSKIHVMSVDDPVYGDASVQKATGAKSLSLYDRITNEVFKQGKNIILKEVGKKVPVGNIPGIGSARDVLGIFGL